MDSSEHTRVMRISFEDGCTEELLATPVGPNVYRLEESAVLGGANYHDVIAAELQPAGILRVSRIVSRSGLKVRTWVVSEDRLKSPTVLALLDRVVAVGGNWEVTFGGVISLHLPPDQERVIVTAFTDVFGGDAAGVRRS